MPTRADQGLQHQPGPRSSQAEARRGLTAGLRLVCAGATSSQQSVCPVRRARPAARAWAAGTLAPSGARRRSLPASPGSTAAKASPALHAERQGDWGLLVLRSAPRPWAACSRAPARALADCRCMLCMPTTSLAALQPSFAKKDVAGHLQTRVPHSSAAGAGEEEGCYPGGAAGGAPRLSAGCADFACLLLYPSQRADYCSRDENSTTHNRHDALACCQAAREKKACKQAPARVLNADKCWVKKNGSGL